MKSKALADPRGAPGAQGQPVRDAAQPGHAPELGAGGVPVPGRRARHGAPARAPLPAPRPQVRQPARGRHMDRQGAPQALRTVLPVAVQHMAYLHNNHLHSNALLAPQRNTPVLTCLTDMCFCLPLDGYDFCTVITANGRLALARVVPDLQGPLVTGSPWLNLKPRSWCTAPGGGLCAGAHGAGPAGPAVGGTPSAKALT